MFFKKRREAKAEAARQDVVNEFQQRFEDAGRCVDPAEKILKLQDICNDVDVKVGELLGKAAKSALTQQRVFFWTATPAAVVASAIYPPALIGLAGMGASVYGGKKISKKFGDSMREKAIEKHRPMIDVLEQQKAQALQTQEELFKEDPRAIAASKNFGDLLSRVPRLREHFAAAYGKKILEDGPSQAQNPQPQNPRTDFRGPSLD